MLRSLIVVVALVCAVLAGLPVFAAESTTPAAAPPTVAASAGQFYVKINGEEVSRDQFCERLEATPMQTQSGPVPTGKYVMAEVISQTLLLQFAKEKGVSPTQEQMDKRLESYKKRAGGSMDQLLAQLRASAADVNTRLMTEQAFINLVSRGITITDEQVKSAYQEAIKDKNSPFRKPDSAEISGIFCKDKARADKAYKQLLAGKNFGTVAGQFSDNPGAKENKGVLGWISSDMQAVPKPVRDIAFSIAVGKFSKPTKVDVDWMIIKVNKRETGKAEKLDDVRDLISDRLAMEAGAAKNNVHAELQAFTEKADIQVKSDRYKEVIDEIKKPRPNMPGPGMENSAPPEAAPPQ